MLTTKQRVPPNSASTEEKRQAQRARSREFGIEALEGKGESLTFPSGFPTNLADYGDPVNLKYPLSPDARARNARARFKQQAATYSRDASKRVVHSRIVERLLRIGASPSFNASDPLDRLLPPRLRDRLQRSTSKRRADMDRRFIEIAKFDLREGEELMEFVQKVQSAITQHGQRSDKGLFLQGIYKGFIVVKDRESGKMLKMEIKRDESGSISLGEPIAVRQQFVPLQKTQKAENEVLTVVAIDGETIAVPLSQDQVVALLKSISEEPADVYALPGENTWSGLPLI